MQSNPKAAKAKCRRGTMEEYGKGAKLVLESISFVGKGGDKNLLHLLQFADHFSKEFTTDSLSDEFQAKLM